MSQVFITEKAQSSKDRPLGYSMDRFHRLLSGTKPTKCMNFTLKLTQVQHRIRNSVPACRVTLGGKAVNFLHVQNLITLKPCKILRF